MFRSTGQSLINHASPDHESVDFEPNETRDVGNHTQAQQIRHRTLSAEEEENCTAGSGTDVLSESPYQTGGIGIAASKADDQSESSQDDEHVECEQVEEEGHEGKGEEPEEEPEEESEGKREESDGKREEPEAKREESDGKGEESEEGKKVVEVNETYAKYLLEKKRLADELKEKSE